MIFQNSPITLNVLHASTKSQHFKLKIFYLRKLHKVDWIFRILNICALTLHYEEFFVSHFVPQKNEKP